MENLKGLEAAVIGGGVAGLCAALTLRRHGASVILYERGSSMHAASGVAAGMLAPALEAAVDPSLDPRFALFRAARDLWPELMRSLDMGPGLRRAGALMAVFADNEWELDPLHDKLQAMGAHAERWDAAETSHAVAGLAGSVAGAVFTLEDWSLDPRAVLRALAEAFAREGGRTQQAGIAAAPDGRLRTERGDELAADIVILATGAQSSPLLRAAPELACLVPIKGQLLAFASAPFQGPAVRTGKVYLAPQTNGVIAGATMEPGATDLRLDPAKLDVIRAEAGRLFPHLAQASAEGRAGVRAATPDGLPLAGPSRRAGVWLATGMRRNGWLLAPLVAELIVESLGGRGGGVYAGQLHPARFNGAQAA